MKRRRDRHRDGRLRESGIEVWVLDDGGARLNVRRTEPPGLQSWGLGAAFYEVEADRPFGFACLRFSVDRDEAARVHAGTMVATRWDARMRRHRLVPASRFDARSLLVHIPITRPGIYGSVGLPRDPRRLAATRLLLALRKGFSRSREKRSARLESLVAAAREHVLLRALPSNREPVGHLARSADDLIDEMAEHLGLDCSDEMIVRMPELDLLGLIEAEVRKARSSPKLPARWPAPREAWRSLGPDNITGRIRAVAVHPTRSDVTYAGAAGGGVWKTVDGGRHWIPTMQKERPLTVGALCMAPSDPEILYAAAGEWTGGVGWPINPAIGGGGVYRTRDGGATWVRCASISSEFCSSAAVDPRDPRVVYVGGDRGLHRSRDGGKTWDSEPGNASALPVPGEVSDIVVAHDAPERIYVGVHRKGVYRSYDGGATWTMLDIRLEAAAHSHRRIAAASAPKIALGRSSAHGSQFVAVKMGNRILTSTDCGDRFSRRGDLPPVPARFHAWCSVIAVDPRDESILYAGDVDLHRSDDGGATWQCLTDEIHEDQHHLVFDPSNLDRIILANDGGVWDSTDRGRNWFVMSDGLVAAQFYNVSVSEGPEWRVAGAMHDESAHVSDGGRAWQSLDLLEGGSVTIDPNDLNRIYHASYFNRLHRIDLGAGAQFRSQSLNLRTSPSCAQAVAVAEARPTAILALEETSGSFRETVRNRVVQLADGAAPQWRVVLPEQSSPYVAVAFAPDEPDVAYAATADARLWRSADGGATWSASDLGEHGMLLVRSIAIDPSDSRRIYLAGQAGNDRASVARVDHEPPAAKLVVLALPHDAGPNESGAAVAVAADPLLDGVLYAAAGTNVWRSLDAGLTWQSMGHGLPAALITGLAMRRYDRALVVSTLGRGMWRIQC